MKATPSHPCLFHIMIIKMGEPGSWLKLYKSEGFSAPLNQVICFSSASSILGHFLVRTCGLQQWKMAQWGSLLPGTDRHLTSWGKWVVWPGRDTYQFVASMKEPWGALGWRSNMGNVKLGPSEVKLWGQAFPWVTSADRRISFLLELLIDSFFHSSHIH